MGRRLIPLKGDHCVKGHESGHLSFVFANRVALIKM